MNDSILSVCYILAIQINSLENKKKISVFFLEHKIKRFSKEPLKFQKYDQRSFREQK